MRIALIGYGKMGKIIEEKALERGHTISMRINSGNKYEFKNKASHSDVAIEFTSPESAFENVKGCIDNCLPVVCGTTGWNDGLEEVKRYCLVKKGTFLYASNFSLGVNLFFELNRELAKLMSPYKDYEVSIKEIHHTQKKDAPSGTAITLAEQVLKEVSHKKGWIVNKEADKFQIAITSERTDPTPGTHHVKYSSAIDDIEIIHTAHNRNGFALGAVLAAEYIFGKYGVFSMSDLLQATSKE